MLQIRNVRERIDRGAVRAHREQSPERIGPAEDRLLGEAVNQVDVEAPETELSCLIHQLRDGIRALAPANDGENRGIEVLHTDREPIEAETTQQLDLRSTGHVGRDLDGDLGLCLDIEAALDGTPEPLDLQFVQRGGRSPAPVDLDQTAPAAEALGYQIQLRLQGLEVFIDLEAIALHDHVAAAEIAHRPAEREMHVEREALPCGLQCI